MQTPVPHATWAHCYDLAYENTYGTLYQHLTDLTVATVREFKPPPCSLVDFGAGTGRLAIPLAQSGYSITAVEPCREMMDVLLSKADAEQLRIHPCIQLMQDFDGRGQFDVALCVFTVVSYLLDEDSLREALTRLARSLRQDGRCLIDVPSHAVFAGYRRQTPVLDRRVTVTPTGGDTYTYHENSRCLIRGEWHDCEDSFPIRFWPATAVLSVLEEHGIECEGPLGDFQGTGADYYKGTKTR